MRASRIYEIITGVGAFSEFGLRTVALIRGRRAVIVTDSNVGPLYGEQMAEALRQEDFSVEAFTFPAGEALKSPGTLLKVLTFFARARLTRQDVTIVLDGGVTDDLTGLVVSPYPHGMPCAQVPISLLTVVDSSVGGETTVNLPKGKNLVGTFAQSYLVLCDGKTLDTLAPEVFAEGVAKVIKCDMTQSREFLELLLRDEATEELEHIAAQCVRLERDVVAEDEQDFSKHQTLNLDHTLGHVIERGMNYKLLHGDCAAIGMALIIRVLMRDDCCPEGHEKTLKKLLKKYQLPNSTELPSERILAAARADKKRRGEDTTLTEPNTLGNRALVKTGLTELVRFLELRR